MYSPIIMPLRRKGSLDLSITAIVVLVIAFVFLGLVLSLTRTIFKGAEEKLPEAIALTQLEAEPTASNPITIPQQVEINRGKTKNINIGFYNRNPETATKARFFITECLDTQDSQVRETNRPKIISGSQNVEASSAAAYSTIIIERELTSGTYVCTIEICEETDACDPLADPPAYEKKQFFLRVTA